MKKQCNKKQCVLALLFVLLPLSFGGAAETAKKYGGASRRMPTTTQLVSVTPNGKSGKGASQLPALSANGRFVAFRSSASNLVENDTNNEADVFVRDLETGTTTLVSVNRFGTDSGNSFSGQDFFPPTLSADGRFIAFSSNASDLVANDTNGRDDVFVRDLITETTKLVSINKFGTTGGNAGSEVPVLSANGRFVAFLSFANDLVANDTNNGTDIFVRDIMNETTTLASVNNIGTDSGNSSSGSIPVLSADGRYVAFTSLASNLTGTIDNNGINEDVFVRDLDTGTTTLASINFIGSATGNNRSFRPTLSANGRYVAFSSQANDLVDLSGFPGTQIYVRDLEAGVTTLATINSSGTGYGITLGANDQYYFSVLNDNGRYVAFASSARNLVAIDNNLRDDVFVRDLETGETALVSVNNSGNNGGNNHSFSPVLSADGRFVAFYSDASDLVANDTNNTSDVFVRDLNSGTTTLVSVNKLGTASGNAPSGDATPALTFGYGRPALSSNEQTVVFKSEASNLVKKDTNRNIDVFVRPTH